MLGLRLHPSVAPRARAWAASRRRARGTGVMGGRSVW